MDRPDTFKQVDPVLSADAIVRQSCADVLGQRDKPVELFTPALLVAHGGFDRDPVIEFDARFPAEQADQRPFFIELQRDHEFFFKGMGATAAANRPRLINWDKRLYCVAKERAEECFAFIGGIAFSDPKKGFFASVFSYKITIPDPTSFRNQYLDVTVFGVIANSFVSLIESRLNKTPLAKKIPMASAFAATQFLRNANIATLFDGTDPLQMRE